MVDQHVVMTATGLADASALVGSPATRNVGTIGGNVMNGSPAMDTGAPLLVLGARVELRNVSATRIVPVGDLWTGPGRTVAQPDELCTAIVLPAPPSRAGSAYVRLEYRRAMEIAVVGAAASVSLNEDGTIATIAVALTAVAPTIIAVGGLESLVGRPVDDALLASVAASASAHAAPISDLRATEDYRRHCVGVMAGRAVAAAARRASGETIGVPVNRAIGIGAAQ
jgi:CO/xanthine dehydrogenase FAD-binding subunit